MSNVAIITARGGSKRIPRKNIKLFRGKPIIAYSIEIALKSGLFDMVMVSTDDEEIALVAKQYGAVIPFYRTAKTSDDYSTTTEVILEVISQLKTLNKNFLNACCIYPTAPFISIKNLQEAYQLLTKQNLTSVFPICQFSYPILRSLKMNENGSVKMIWPEYQDVRSQDLPPSYHDAGQFYWINIDFFLKDKKIFTGNSGAIILKELEVQDIDSDIDWKIAEIKHSLLFSSND